MATIQSFINGLYTVMYGRVADSTGYSYWLGQVGSTAAGATTTAITDAQAQALAGSFQSTQSTYFTQQYGTLSDAAFITALYVNLGGNSTVAGADLVYWQTKLASFGGDRAKLAGQFTQEFINYSGTDANALARQAAFNNKISVSIQYVTTSASNAFMNSAATTDAAFAAETLILQGVSNAPATRDAAIAQITAAATAGKLTPIVGQPVSNQGQVFTLTNAVDAPGTGAFATSSITGNNNTIYGTFNSATATANTFTAGDQVVANPGTVGNTFNLTDAGTGGTGVVNVAGTTVSNISNVLVNSAEAVTANTTSGFTGLTSLTVNAAGGAASTVTAAATTNVAFTDAPSAAVTDSVQGGLNVVVVENGISAAGRGALTVGDVAAAVGTIAVTENVASSSTGVYTAGAVAVKGGTTVTVTENLAGTAGAGNTVTSGTVTVTGTATTTAVTVNQTAAATAANAIGAVTGVSATVGATAAAPGIAAVAATTQATATAAKAAVAGVVDGAVTINDANAGSATLAGTIASVTLANAAGATISSPALNSLSLTGNNGTVALTEGGSTAATNTTLALSLNGTTIATTVTDASNQFTTVNATLVAASTLAQINDTKLATLAVSGTGVLSITNALNNAVKTLTVAGAAGLNADITGTAVTSLTGANTTGTFNLSINDTKTSFTGGAGQDILIINADATKALTGGSATNNEIIFNNGAATFNATSAKLTNTNVTGFQVFGLGASATASTWDMSTFNSSFNSIDITAGQAGANLNQTFNKVATGTTINIAAADTATLAFNYVDTTGASDVVGLTLGTAKTGQSTFNAVTLQDANAVGVGTLNVNSLGTDIGNAGGALNTITTLTDNGLSVLNVSGTAGLTITTLNEATSQAAAFTINSTETGQNGTTITTFTDTALGNLTFKGTNAADIAQLNVAGGTVTNLTISNTGTGSATVGDGTAFQDAILKTLNLNGNVQFGPNTTAFNATTNVTNGFTVNGATDNSHVSVGLAGAAALSTDTFVLGNGNNFIQDSSTAGTVNVTVGTGANLIKLGDFAAAGTTANTAVYNVTLGAHTPTATAFDQIFAPDTGAYWGGTATSEAITPTLIVTGAVKGDVIVTTDTAGALAILTPSASQLATLAAAATLAQAINGASAIETAAHQAVAFIFGGNTYVVEDVAKNTAAATSSVIELVGSHTIAANATNGAFILAS